MCGVGSWGRVGYDVMVVGGGGGGLFLFCGYGDGREVNLVMRRERQVCIGGR